MGPTSLLLLVASLASTALGDASSKRGLVYVASADHPSDDSIWIRSGSDLTWYYNYGVTPTSSLSSSDLEFVPMMWGASDSDATSTTFYDSVKGLIDGGTKVKYVLAFNEPDGKSATGGSSVSAGLAAAVWMNQLEPLKKLGVQLGAPAVTGAPSGWTWLQEFFTQCNGKCTVDFIPIHWYGNFDGMAGHVGQVISTYPNISSVWVTEFALAHEDLNSTQQFYNQSTAMLDRWSNVTRYSYFGAFRSDVSNVGPNVAMLTEKGLLTDIGSWYLGGVATNNIPHGAAGQSVKSFFGWTAVVAITTLLLC